MKKIFTNEKINKSKSTKPTRNERSTAGPLAGIRKKRCQVKNPGAVATLLNK